jgi:four helix bundle protein
VSIMNNIAKGFERNTNKELRNFLYIAKGSAGETRSMIMFAYEIELINGSEKKMLTERSIEVSKILSGLIKTL